MAEGPGRGFPVSSSRKLTWITFGGDRDGIRRFEDAEKILSTRIALLRSIRQRESAEQFLDEPSQLYLDATAIEEACLLGLSQRARAEEHLEVAFNCVTLAQGLDLPREDGLASRPQVTEEYANILWAKGEHAVAIEALRGLLEGVKDDAKLRASGRARLLASLVRNSRRLSSMQIK
jgi:ataxia telangiectasia mutated family protein